MEKNIIIFTFEVNMIYNELKQHGKDDFPFELYMVDERHPRYEMAFHFHKTLELIRVLKGGLLLTLDGKKYELSTGDIAVINSEVVHGATPQSSVYECIGFDLEFLKNGNGECDEFIDSLLSHGTFINELLKDAKTKETVNTLFDEIRKKGRGMPFKVIGLFGELLGEIRDSGEFASHHGEGVVHDEKKNIKLRTVLKFIRANFSENISLDDMAAVAGLSRKYFCKFFKDMTGTTPVSYLMAYRVERAARKLLSTDLSVTQIAFDCGFADVSYFIKTFKAYRGVPPAEYRKM